MRRVLSLLALTSLSVLAVTAGDLTGPYLETRKGCPLWNVHGRFENVSQRRITEVEVDQFDRVNGRYEKVKTESVRMNLAPRRFWDPLELGFAPSYPKLAKYAHRTLRVKRVTYEGGVWTWEQSNPDIDRVLFQNDYFHVPLKRGPVNIDLTQESEPKVVLRNDTRKWVARVRVAAVVISTNPDLTIPGKWLDIKIPPMSSVRLPSIPVSAKSLDEELRRTPDATVTIQYRVVAADSAGGLTWVGGPVGNEWKEPNLLDRIVEAFREVVSLFPR